MGCVWCVLFRCVCVFGWLRLCLFACLWEEDPYDSSTETNKNATNQTPHQAKHTNTKKKPGASPCHVSPRHPEGCKKQHTRHTQPHTTSALPLSYHPTHPAPTRTTTTNTTTHVPHTHTTHPAHKQHTTTTHTKPTHTCALRSYMTRKTGSSSTRARRNSAPQYDSVRARYVPVACFVFGFWFGGLCVLVCFVFLGGCAICLCVEGDRCLGV